MQRSKPNCSTAWMRIADESLKDQPGASTKTSPLPASGSPISKRKWAGRFEPFISSRDRNSNDRRIRSSASDWAARQALRSSRASRLGCRDGAAVAACGILYLSSVCARSPASLGQEVRLAAIYHLLIRSRICPLSPLTISEQVRHPWLLTIEIPPPPASCGRRACRRQPLGGSMSCLRAP